MGRASRQNPTAQAARRGELLSRSSILGAMDHALEVHASSLRLAHEKIARLEQIVAVMAGAPSLMNENQPIHASEAE